MKEHWTKSEYTSQTGASAIGPKTRYPVALIIAIAWRATGTGVITHELSEANGIFYGAEYTVPTEAANSYREAHRRLE